MTEEQNILKVIFNTMLFKLWYFITFTIAMPSKKRPEKRKAKQTLKLIIDKMIIDLE